MEVGDGGCVVVDVSVGFFGVLYCEFVDWKFVFFDCCGDDVVLDCFVVEVDDDCICDVWVFGEVDECLFGWVGGGL